MCAKDSLNHYSPPRQLKGTSLTPLSVLEISRTYADLQTGVLTACRGWLIGLFPRRAIASHSLEVPDTEEIKCCSSENYRYRLVIIVAAIPPKRAPKHW